MSSSLGVQNAMPADEHLLDILLAETRRVIPGATWTAAGIGREQSGSWLGAGARRGCRPHRLEDNIRVSKDRLAASNAELVSIAAELAARHGGRPATLPAEARACLGLRAA